jgi:hypothetical protein
LSVLHNRLHIEYLTFQYGLITVLMHDASIAAPCMSCPLNVQSPYHVNAGLLCSEVLVQMQAQQQQQQQALSCSPAALLHIGTGENGAGASVGAGSSTPMSLG